MKPPAGIGTRLLATLRLLTLCAAVSPFAARLATAIRCVAAFAAIGSATCAVGFAATDPLADAERQFEAAKHHDHSAGEPRRDSTGDLAARPSPGSDRREPARPAGSPTGVAHTVPDAHTHPPPHIPHSDHTYLEAFELGFMRRAMLAGLLTGCISAWLGTFVLLRRLVFVSVALAQVASAGIAACVLAGCDPVAGGMIATIAAALLSGSRESRGGLPGEARMGLMYVIAGSVAILCLAKSATGEAEQLEMLQGNLLIVSDLKLGLLVATALGLLVLHGFGWSRLVAVAFDPVSAAVERVRVRAWDAAFFLALGTGIGVAVQSAGLLLVFTYLLVPPCIGLATGWRLPGMLATAMASQAVATIAGLWMAYELDLPGGPAIALVLIAILGVTAATSWAVRRRAP